MVLYWVRGKQSNRPTVLTYIGNHTAVNDAARKVFNGSHSSYFPKLEKKFDPKNDVLLWSEDHVALRGFHHDELQEESDDS